MREKLTKFKNAISRSNGKCKFLLSIVALIEIIMIMTVSTFSWVESISSVKISNEGKTGSIGSSAFTKANMSVGTGNTASIIDLSEYFRASGNVHLSAASSADGINFFFPKLSTAGNAAQGFRKGTINDINTNYISFSFEVKAEGRNQNFFFDSVPKFLADDEEITDNSIRVAISVADGTSKSTRIYSYKNEETSVIANEDGTTTEPSKIYAFKDFTNKTTADADKILFSVQKDETKIITLTMWLQYFTGVENNFNGKTISASDFKIVSAKENTLITFVDKTSGFNSTTTPTKSSWQWVSDDNAKMWVKTASNKSYVMTKAQAEAGSAPMWTASIPTEDLGNSSGDMYFYRTKESLTSNPENDCYNFWKTKLSDDTSKKYVYSAYGAKLGENNKQVYGTWGELSEIQLFSSVNNVLPIPSSANATDIVKVTLENSNNVKVEMNYNGTGVSAPCWRAYIPKDNYSENLIFSFSDKNIKNIRASGRVKNKAVSKYYVTSSTTGYWDPGVQVKVGIYGNKSGYGTVKVSGGAANVTTVKVTKGAQVTVTATANPGYAFKGWYTDSACTKLADNGNKSVLVFNAEPSEKTYEYYAKFVEKLYLKPNGNWTKDNARFAAFFMASDKNVNAWVSMNPNESDNSYYEVTIPEGDWKYVIFCRMNPDKSENNFNDDVRWNQTKDLEIPTNGDNCYTVDKDAWSNGDGTWSKYNK